jgi:hypothetical protein
MRWWKMSMFFIPDSDKQTSNRFYFFFLPFLAPAAAAALLS